MPKKLIRITTVPQSLRGLLPGQMQFMSQHFDVIAISSPGRELQDVAEKEQVRTIAVPMSRSITPIEDLKSVLALYKIFKRERPFIVHTHTPKAGTVGMIAAKIAGVPHRLHTVAGLPLLEATGNRRKLLDFVEKVTYWCATRVYPNSKGLKNIIENNKLTSDAKLKVIGNGSSNGIDTTHFSPAQVSAQKKDDLRSQLNYTAEHFIYLFIGRLVKDKGINELVSAFLNLQRQNPHARLLLVGSLEQDLDPLHADILDAINNNRFIDYVGPQADVRPYFAIADVLAFPSYREGFPNVVMQAGAMGVNSIVSDINGCNEIIREGINGFIIPVKNEQALFEKMEYLYNNPDINREMASRSRDTISQNYERNFVWGELLKEYQMLNGNSNV